MSNAHQFLFGLGVPAAIVIVAGFFWSLMTRGNSAGVTISLAAGLVQCFRVLFNDALPDFKSVEVEPRATVAVAALAVILALLSPEKIPGFVRWIVMLIVPAALVWFVFSPLPASSMPKEELWHWIAIAGGVSAVLVLLIELISRGTGPASAALILGPWCAGAAGVLLMCGSLKLGWLTASIAVMLFGAFLVSLVAAPTILSKGPITLVIAAVAALLAHGYFDNDGTLTRTELGLLAGAPLLAFIAQLPPIGRAKPWKREILRLLLVLIPVGVAVGMAYIQFKKDSGAGPEM